MHMSIPRGFPGGASNKELSCNAGNTGDMASIPGSGRSPGGGRGLENPVDRGAWQATGNEVAKS